MIYLDWLIFLLYLVLTGYIIAVCGCRVNLLYAKKHRYIWVIQYALMVLFAGGAFADAFSFSAPVDWTSLGGLIAFAIHLYATRRAWANGVPPVAFKWRFFV